MSDFEDFEEEMSQCDSRGMTLCNECNGYFEYNEMCDTTGKLCYHAYVCQECYNELESDEE